MRLQRTGLFVALLGLASCVEQPQMVMMNPHTGTVVGCPIPDRLGNSGEYLVSRACMSACAAHGFRPVLGAESKGSGDATPIPCLN